MEKLGGKKYIFFPNLKCIINTTTTTSFCIFRNNFGPVVSYFDLNIAEDTRFFYKVNLNGEFHIHLIKCYNAIIKHILKIKTLSKRVLDSDLYLFCIC